MTEVSVVLPTFNRWPMLAEAVASVMAQRGVDFELIIVDDGSTDETAARLPRLAEELEAGESPVRILRTGNHGPAAARNRGVVAARAPLIAFLDSDDVWLPGKLQRQLDDMRHKPESLASQTDEIWVRQGVRVNPGRRHRKRGGDFFLDSLRTCLVSPSSVMMRTSAFRALGGFDEDMRAAEDYDLWLRLLLEHPVEFLPEPLVIRRAGHPGQLSATVPALDRFRILALLKLLLRDDLRGQQREAVCDTLIEKCRIYGNGAARRGNTMEADLMARLAVMSGKDWRRFADSSLESAIVAMRADLVRQSTSPRLVRGRRMMNSAKTNRDRFGRSGEPTPGVPGESPEYSQRETSPRGVNEKEVEHRLHRWADAKALPAAYAQKWLALDEPGRTRLLEIAESLKMHTGQLIAALALLEEIAVREGQTIGEILDRPALRRILGSTGSGPGRARVMLDELRSLRYPRLKRVAGRLAEKLAAIKLPPGVRIVLPRDLASDEVRVEIVAHGSVEMEQVLAYLTAKAGELVRLAAMLSGTDECLEVDDAKQ